jgi:hypothetical protein
MAGSEKRKISEDEGGGIVRDTGVPCKARYRRHIGPSPSEGFLLTCLSPTKKPRKNRSRRTDRFSILPGEIRNQIYELLLIEDGPVHVGTCRTHKDGDLGTWRYIRKWKQSPLFSVSKQIRSEAMSMYYGSNTVTLTCFNKEFDIALQYYAKILAACGNSPDISVSIIFGLKSWHDMAAMFLPAKFIYSTDLGFDDQTEEVEHWASTFGDSGGKPWFSVAFRDAMLIAVKARHRGQSYAQLEEDLRDWAWAKLAWLSSTGKPKLWRQNLVKDRYELHQKFKSVLDNANTIPQVMDTPRPPTPEPGWTPKKRRVPTS